MAYPEDQDVLPTHKVRLDILLADLPFPVSGKRVGGEYRLPAESIYLYSLGFSDDHRDMALTQLMHGLEQLVRTTEDKLRDDWCMETRQQKAKREFEEERRLRVSRMFADDYGLHREIPARFLFGKTPVQDDDYPLGEVPAL